MMFTIPSNMWGLTPRIGCSKKAGKFMRHPGQSVSIAPLTRMVTVAEAISMTDITFEDRNRLNSRKGIYLILGLLINCHFGRQVLLHLKVNALAKAR